ncbi:MAG TPA: hypothetical protein VE086_00035 [Chthoniobacterales bacterium]|nr:hypothetical protein [Chthoniobacterales bacterium]
MEQPLRAEEDLRIIRSLMERATIYRAISAPTALVGGFLALLASAAIHLVERSRSGFFEPFLGTREFAAIWLCVLLVVLIANTFFVWREAQKSGRPFISAGMKLALRAVAPCLLLFAVVTGWVLSADDSNVTKLALVSVWIGLYGLALLSTALFAPRALVVLGWAFLLTSLTFPVWNGLFPGHFGRVPNMAMAITFGLYHLVYAACTWGRNRILTGDQPILE